MAPEVSMSLRSDSISLTNEIHERSSLVLPLGIQRTMSASKVLQNSPTINRNCHDVSEQASLVGAGPFVTTDNERIKSGEDGRRDAMAETFLLRLFKSCHLDTWLAVWYMQRYASEGIRAYLCNRIFEMPFKEVEAYFPQLVCMCVGQMTPGDPLERLVVYLSCYHPSLALLTVWALDCYLQDDLSSNEIKDYCKSLRSEILDTRAKSNEMVDPVMSLSIVDRLSCPRLGTLYRPKSLPKLFAKLSWPENHCEDGPISSNSMPAVVPAVQSAEAESVTNGSEITKNSTQLKVSLGTFLRNLECAQQVLDGLPSNLPMKFYLEPETSFFK